MRVVMFCHSLLSDWNHGNAHFLRGVVGELLADGHQVRVWEPYEAWSLRRSASAAHRRSSGCVPWAYPHLSSTGIAMKIWTSMRLWMAPMSSHRARVEEPTGVSATSGGASKTDWAVHVVVS